MRVMRAEGVDFVKEHVDRKEPCLHDKDPETVKNDPETVKRPIQDPETVKKDPETVKRPIPCHKEGEVYKAKATIDGSGESKVGIERQLKPAVNQATTTSATAPCASADGGSEAEGHVCETSDWEAWSPCSATCGQHGNSTRSRTVLKQSLRDGPPCAELNQVRECQLPECPLDCVWLEWSEWGSCSVSCGTGTKFSTRDRFFERFGGSACVGSDARSEGCLVKQCSTNCTMSPWSDWFACSTSCGNGTATRYRNVETVADNTNCSNPTSESAACCNQECPIDCVLGSWTDWTSCGNGCNVDHSTRTRNVVVEPKAGGLTCDVTSEAKNCSSLCHVDCRYGPWSDWNYCSITCGAGTRSRLRAEVVTQQGTGEDCTGARQNIQSCTSTDCPVDCQASEWTEWSACSSSCGSDSFADRTRDVTSLADKNGLPCPGGNETHQQKRCSQQACPVACEWTDWQEWRSCTRTCGHGGTQLRMRLVATPSQHGGIECQGNSTDTQECTDVPSCPEPCSWNDWSDWIQCSASCGSNSTTRRNRTYMPAVHGGQACFGDSEQEKSCYEPPCPVNGVWSDWSEWNCQASCSPATQKRYREKTEPEHGGKECQGSAVETSACENIPLCPVDCTWSHWSTWSFCSATCGVGTRTRLRNRTQYEEHGGGSCYGTQDDEAVCTAGECPQDCVVGDWSHWTACPASCGTGNRTRHRKVQREAKNGGADCPSDLLQTDCCATKDCPVDCEWSDWRDWSECPNSCGGGIQTRVRHEAQFPWHGGLPCDGGIKQDSVCNEQSCPMDCKFAEWSDWGQCSATCGSGKKEMMRHKINIAMFGGKDCTGPEKLVEDCNNGECSIDCAWAEWTNWTECSKSCETGLTQRTRAHSINVSQGGAECVGVAQEETACNTHGCAQDCQWGPWSKWTPCSKQCGGGSTKRFRDVVSVRKNYGLACEGEDQQEELCNVAECAINCEWDEWTSWSTCSLAATVASEREPEVRKCPANMAELNAKAIPVRSFLAIFPRARLTARSRPGVAGAIARHSVELAGDSRPGVDSKVVMVVWTALVG